MTCRLVACRVAATVAFAAAFPLSASAQGLGIKGTWGLSEKACTMKGPSEGRLVIDGQSLKFYESTCKIARLVAGRGRGVWYVTLKCSGEGSTWTNNDLYVVRAKGARMVRITQRGLAISYVRCK